MNKLLMAEEEVVMVKEKELMGHAEYVEMN